MRLLGKVSQNDCAVLILGESGTGKELAARSIHQSGPRATCPFIPIDCAAMAATLIESELFGHVRGAFTGAVQSKRGLIEAAQGGTIFLDEIAEMPVELQAKLLRALQENEIRPLGSTSQVSIDVRIIAATNRDLEAAIQQGTFRSDLYYRLDVVTIKLPPLRERKGDIPLLAKHFVERFTPPGLPLPTLSEEAVARLMSYDWPGNVRELGNCIQRAVALGSGSTIESSDLVISVRNPRGLCSAEAADRVIPLCEVERRAILHAIDDAQGNIPLAAKHLGIGKTTLYRKLKEYGPSPSSPSAVEKPGNDSNKIVPSLTS